MIKKNDQVSVIDGEGTLWIGPLHFVWENVSNITWDTLRSRLRRGWTAQKALTTPANTAMYKLGKCGQCGHHLYGNSHSCEQCETRTEAGLDADRRKRMKNGRRSR